MLNTTGVGAGAATFSAAVDFVTGQLPFSVAAGSLDGDASPDLTVANSNGSVSVLRNSAPANDATPSFDGIDYPTETGAFSVAIGDLNGDGKPDLAVTSINGVVSVLLAL